MAFLVVLGLLDPDATAIADGGGLAITFLRPIEGGEHIARAWVEIADRAPSTMTFLERTVNGQPGLVARQDGVTLTVFAFHIAADRIKHIWVVRNRRNSVAGRRARGRQPAMPPSSVHFNGSVNLPDAETVMREISARIPEGVRRMTDGETGERNYWIHFQIRKFRQMPEFEEVSGGPAIRAPDGAPADGAAAARRAAPRPTRSTGPTSATPTSTASRSRSSTASSRRARSRPVCASSCSTRRRWPRWPGRSCPRTSRPSRPPTRRRCSPTSARPLAALPHDRIAIQWDVAVEFGLLEGAYGPLRSRWSDRARASCAASSGCRRTCRSGCTSATATTATSTSSSPSRCGCRSTSSTPSRPPRAAVRLGVVHGPAGPRRRRLLRAR